MVVSKVLFVDYPNSKNTWELQTEAQLQEFHKSITNPVHKHLGNLTTYIFPLLPRCPNIFTPQDVGAIATLERMVLCLFSVNAYTPCFHIHNIQQK